MELLDELQRLIQANETLVGIVRTHSEEVAVQHHWTSQPLSGMVLQPYTAEELVGADGGALLHHLRVVLGLVREVTALNRQAAQAGSRLVRQFRDRRLRRLRDDQRVRTPSDGPLAVI